MHWENYEPEIRKQMSIAPGGTELADTLIKALDPQPDHHLLDISDDPGTLASVVAKEYNVRLTTVAKDAQSEASAESTASLLGVADRLRVIPGSPAALPVPSEEFHCIYCLGYPFNPPPTPALSREIYRVLVPDGIVGYAGPMSLNNITPDYMSAALDEFDGVKLRTPAYTALHFSREGFHIATAEFIPAAWDHWNVWLENAPPGLVTDTLKNAIIEDGGRWLSLGLIVLRKPPKPRWAV